MTLQNLILLQAVDLDLRRLRAELTELPKRMAAAMTALQAAQKALAATKKGLTDEEVLRRKQELDVAAHKTKVERLQRQLDEATSAAQVTALEHQLEFTRAAIAKLEEEEFGSLERTEELEAALGGRETALAQAEALLERTKTVGAETTARHETAIKSLDGERARLRTELLNPPADWAATAPEAPAALAIYERVAKGKGTGLAEATPDASGGGQCAACRMRIRQQRWHDIASKDHRNELFSCESCARMLFFDPRRNSPGDEPAIDRLHAALAGEEKR